MPSPLSNRDVPNWRTPRSVPLTSYRKRNASGMPALVCPGSVPSSWPGPSTPDRPTATPDPASPPGEPYWRVHTALPSGSYFRRNVSARPALASPGNDPPTRPVTYTPVASAATASAAAYVLVPNWRVHSTSPRTSYFRTNASVLPWSVSPGNEPLVVPATYTPVASTARPEA